MTAAVASGRAVLVGHFTPGSPEWHAARADGLGGSEIASVLGLSPWESRFALWHRKQGLLAPVTETPEMKWGHRHEPTICAEFAELHPELAVHTAGTYAHPDRPWQLANPDRLLVDTSTGRLALLEAKTARDAYEWGPTGGGAEAIPVYYLTQVLWYLDVFGYDEAWLAVLIGGSDYREYRIYQDQADAELIRNAGLGFMNSLWTDERPNIDDHTATYSAIRELHPDIQDVEVEIDEALARHYRMALAISERADKRATFYKSRVLDQMGSGRRAVSEGERIAIRVASRAGATPHLRPTKPPKENAA